MPVPHYGASAPGHGPSALASCIRAGNDRNVAPFECETLNPQEPPVSVLLVEDDPLIREFVVDALREAGYHVIHASTGEEALAWCDRRVADVLITDVRLPGQVDGWQIAERYREQYPNLPVVYATGFSPVPPRPVQGSRIVRKPFHPDEIVRVVQELGETRRAPPT
ncbi:response regulator [Bradyrhizobium sp. CCBAU 53351]|nr:response regulator [Bradyrhizobium sp. CCBAU 53351]